MVAQANLLKRGHGAVVPLGARHARQRERQLHVGEHRLVGDEVVALEHEADAVVAVGVPILVFVLFGGDAVDDEVARVVVVEAAHDVEQRGLARAGGAEYRHELVVAERHRHVVERGLREVRRGVGLAYVEQLQHEEPFRARFVEEAQV